MGVRLVFESSDKDSTLTQMECFANTNGEIFISIETDDYPPNHITLDRDTAIKFSKTLRTEISKLQNIIQNGRE